jgi:hypothetical protein
LLDIEIGKLARDDVQGLNRLRRIATLVAKALDSPSQLGDAVLGFCNSPGNSDKSASFTSHVTL